VLHEDLLVVELPVAVVAEDLLRPLLLLPHASRSPAAGELGFRRRREGGDARGFGGGEEGVVCGDSEGPSANMTSWSRGAGLGR
jgi:hypothetical protein